MNILMIGNAFPPTYMGGESLHLHDLAMGLTDRGHRLIVVHPSPATENRVTVRLQRVNRNLDVYRICRPEASCLDAQMNEIFLDLLKNLLRTGEKLDLVHCHSNRFYEGIRSLTEIHPIPLVTTVHTVSTALVCNVMLKKGMTPKTEEWRSCVDEIERQKGLCAGSARTITVSNAMASHLVKYFEADPGKVRLVYNGVNVKHLSDQRSREKGERLREDLHLGNSVVVLYVGRMEPIKGIGPLAEACSRLSERYDHVGFIFLGNGSADIWLRTLLQKHKNVHFVNWQPFDGVIPYYHLADIAVIPSLIEAFGLVPLEAMACRTCVLCSNADGMDETVVHEESGFKIPLFIDSDGDRRIRAEDIENALERAISDPEWRMRLAEGGLRRAAQFTVERMVQETERVYSELLGQTSPDL